MDFRINKIDLELRSRVKETTKSGVVHRKGENIVKTIDEGSKQNKKNFAQQLKKASKKEEKKKEDSVSVKAFKETKDDKGIFIDIRK